ncbi:MAG: hypothetical protein KGV51_02175 [Moraxellaceae bacterium]|nr:hypothetical protein [Moraxellaceae bacterium]
MIKNIHLSALGLSIACLLTVSGCDMFGNKDDTTADKTKEKSSQTTSRKASVNVDEVCAETGIPTNLEKSLKAKFVQQSTAFVVAQNSDIDLDTDKVSAESDKIAVSISDVKAVEGTKVSETGLVSCQANVSLELPEDMVKRSNEVYRANNQEDDVLDANRIKDEAFTFMVDTNAKENNLQILGQSALLGVVSNTLANSALKAQGGISKLTNDTKTSTRSNTVSNNTAAPTVTSKQSVAPRKSTTTAEQRAAAKKRAQARAKKRAQQRAVAKKRAQQKALAKKRAQAKAKAQQKATAKAKAQVKAKTQQKATAKAKAQAKVQPKPQQKAVAKPKDNESSAIKKQQAKEGIKDSKQIQQKSSVATQQKPAVQAKPVTPVQQQAPAKKSPSKPLGVNNSDNIEVVIVEESGTY